MKIINIKKQANYLYKRFKDAKESRYSSFKVNDNDFKALLDVVGYIDILIDEKVAKNTLFAKLYIYQLNQMMLIYGTDVLEDIPQKELSKILDTPLEYYFKAFHDKIKVRDNDKIIHKLKNGSLDDKKIFVNERYNLEYCENKLTEMINEALIRFE